MDLLELGGLLEVATSASDQILGLTTVWVVEDDDSLVECCTSCVDELVDGAGEGDFVGVTGEHVLCGEWTKVLSAADAVGEEILLAVVVVDVAGSEPGLCTLVDNAAGLSSPDSLSLKASRCNSFTSSTDKTNNKPTEFVIQESYFLSLSHIYIYSENIKTPIIYLHLLIMTPFFKHV